MFGSNSTFYRFAVVPDDGNLFLDVPDAPQDRPTSPGQFLTLNKPSAPARIMISLAIRARTHIRRRKHIHIQTHTQCMRVCVRARIRAYGCVAHARALAREHNSIPVSSHPLLPLRPLPESPPSHPLPRTTLLQYSLIVQVWPSGFCWSIAWRKRNWVRLHFFPNNHQIRQIIVK